MNENREDCIWMFDEVHDKWDTQCGQSFCFNDGTDPEENGMNFCPYCGDIIISKKIRQG